MLWVTTYPDYQTLTGSRIRIHSAQECVVYLLPLNCVPVLDITEEIKMDQTTFILCVVFSHCVRTWLKKINHFGIIPEQNRHLVTN
jgi:hypothetical protein